VAESRRASYECAAQRSHRLATSKAYSFPKGFDYARDEIFIAQFRRIFREGKAGEHPEEARPQQGGSNVYRRNVRAHPAVPLADDFAMACVSSASERTATAAGVLCSKNRITFRPRR